LKDGSIEDTKIHEIYQNFSMLEFPESVKNFLLKSVSNGMIFLRTGYEKDQNIPYIDVFFPNSLII